MIPRVLNRAVANIGLARVAAPYLGTAPALIICGLLTIISFYVMTPIAASNPLPTADAMPLAFAGVSDRFLYHGESPPRSDADSRISHVGKRHLSYSLSWRPTACRSSSKWGFFSTSWSPC